MSKGDARSAGQSLPSGYSCGRNESTPRTRVTVLPDFAQVYGFIGSVFDPNVTGHLQKLKKMDPIDIETRRLLSTYEIDSEKDSALDLPDTVLAYQSDDAT